MSIFSSEKPKLAIVFDVGSSSVRAGAFLLRKGQKPQLVYSDRAAMVFQDTFRFERFVSSMLETLEVVAERISKEKFPPHSEKTITCFMASPWYASQTRLAKKTFTEPTEVTEKILQGMYDTESAAFKEQEDSIMKVGTEIFQMENIQTKLNGYETAHPHGKKAKEVQISLYNAIASKKILQSFQEKIRKYFPRAEIKFFAFPFSAFAAIRDIFHEKMFLVLDIAGEMTDISVVRDNVLQVTTTYPKGKNFVIRELMSKMKVSSAEAFTLFHMHKDEVLHEKDKKEVADVLDSVGEEWRGELEKTLKELSTDSDYLPHNVFLTADTDVSDWFSDRIQDPKLSQFSLSGDIFTVRHLNSPFLTTFCDSDAKIERDPFLMLEGLFLSRF